MTECFRIRGITNLLQELLEIKLKGFDMVHSPLIHFFSILR